MDLGTNSLSQPIPDLCDWDSRFWMSHRFSCKTTAWLELKTALRNTNFTVFIWKYRWILVAKVYYHGWLHTELFSAYNCANRLGMISVHTYNYCVYFIYCNVITNRILTCYKQMSLTTKKRKQVHPLSIHPIDRWHRHPR